MKTSTQICENVVDYTGYQLFAGDLSELPVKDKVVINTINQYSFCVAEQNSTFKQVLQNSDVLLPDGIGILVAVKLQTNQSIRKISGSDLHQFLLERLNLLKGSCFYLGSSGSTLEKIQRHLKVNYPNVKAGFYSPPYKTAFSKKDNLEMTEAVNDFAPDVLFVGMTAPKQEIWVDQNKENLDASTICCIGAVFDFFAGTVQRPNPFYVNNGLEWFGRLIHEPKRMWKRYLVFGPVFLFLLIKYKLQFKMV